MLMGRVRDMSTPKKVRSLEGPRPYRAGRQVAEALCETAHILYLRDNRKQYLEGIRDRVLEELEK